MKISTIFYSKKGGVPVYPPSAFGQPGYNPGQAFGQPGYNPPPPPYSGSGYPSIQPNPSKYSNSQNILTDAFVYMQSIYLLQRRHTTMVHRGLFHQRTF